VHVDPRTLRQYLVVGDGTRGLIYMIDATATANITKPPLAIASVVGPKAMHVTGTKVYVLDANGVVASVDLAPAVPCRLVFNYTEPLFGIWGKPGLEDTKQVIFHDQIKTLYLRRKAASSTSSLQPWSAMVSKKVQWVKGFQLTKHTTCIKPAGLMVQSECCVKKGVKKVAAQNSRKASTESLQRALAEM